MKEKFFLTYFDESLNRRVSYLNNTVFPSEERARYEFKRWLLEEQRRNKNGFFSGRSKWAIEKSQNGRRILIDKNLNNK